MAVVAEVDSTTADADSREAVPPRTVVSPAVATVAVDAKCTRQDVRPPAGRPHAAETTPVSDPQHPSNATATRGHPTTVSVAATTTEATENDDEGRALASNSLSRERIRVCSPLFLHKSFFRLIGQKTGRACTRLFIPSTTRAESV